MIAAGEVASSPPSPAILPIVGAMAALAGLDLLGAVFARSWSEQRSNVAFVAGMVVFATLFAVYAKSLDYAELSTVTVGWVVLLQVGVLIMDKLHGVVIPTTRLSAIGVIVLLQVYITFSDVRS
jgi:hypothetical protein